MIGILLVLALTALLAPVLVRTGRIAPIVMALAPAASFATFAFGLDHVPNEVRIPWVQTLNVELAFRLDGLSRVFALLITGIGTLIVVYAWHYMKGHPLVGRFFLLLMLFMTSMLGLVLADDALAAFVFWEGTSITSYLLIGFDHDDASARASARKALVITGAGGLAMLGGFIMVQAMTESFALSQWLTQADEIRAHPWSNVALVLIMLGALTKSAQVPFHFWLPAAMAGPTPVSAFLHSATMVKAGVFLLARLAPIWSDAPLWTGALVTIGAVTMLASAWSALRFTDIKSVLAHTTTMALGLLVLLLGFGDEASVHAAITYLLVHAFYKGTLFMVAGSVDHGAGTRELGALGGLAPRLKVTATAAALGCASMAGLPPFIGFIGKELSYEANLHAAPPGLWVLVAAVLANAALFGVSLVLFAGPFLGRATQAAEHAHEELGLALPPVVLAVTGLVTGLVPGTLDALVSDASASVLGRASEVHLALWHGVNPALGASALTFTLGGLVFVGSGRLRASAGFARTVDLFADGVAQVFERCLWLVGEIARVVVTGLYGQSLRRSVLLIATVLAGSLLAMALRNGFPQLPPWTEILPHETALLLLLVVSAFASAFSRRPLNAIVAVSVSGFCVAIIYLLFGAPDVAMTQFSIETLTVFVVVLTLLHLPRGESHQVGVGTWVSDLTVAFGGGAMVAALLLAVLSNALPGGLGAWYLNNSVPRAHGHNVVNVILVDFRGFDTWGEITVLTIAGLGVSALFRPSASEAAQRARAKLDRESPSAKTESEGSA